MSTTFKAYLPIVKSMENGKEATGGTANPSSRGAETILLAEDDKQLREMTLTFLKAFGYKVITALDGEEAIQKFMENKDDIHLLLFDLTMPKKTGKEAYDAIRAIRPAVKVIFVSGYAADAIRREILMEKGASLLSKPVVPTELLEKVREVLGSSPSENQGTLPE